MTKNAYQIIGMDGIIPIGTKVSFMVYGRDPSGIGSIRWRKVLGTVVSYQNIGTNEYPIIAYTARNKVTIRGRVKINDYMVHADDITIKSLLTIPEGNNENNGTGGGRTRKRKTRRRS
jgi:hypothetical protein